MGLSNASFAVAHDHGGRPKRPHWHHHHAFHCWLKRQCSCQSCAIVGSTTSGDTHGPIKCQLRIPHGHGGCHALHCWCWLRRQYLWAIGFTTWQRSACCFRGNRGHPKGPNLYRHHALHRWSWLSNFVQSWALPFAVHPMGLQNARVLFQEAMEVIRKGGLSCINVMLYSDNVIAGKLLLLLILIHLFSATICLQAGIQVRFTMKVHSNMDNCFCLQVIPLPPYFFFMAGVHCPAIMVQSGMPTRWPPSPATTTSNSHQLSSRTGVWTQVLMSQWIQKPAAVTIRPRKTLKRVFVCHPGLYYF